MERLTQSQIRANLYRNVEKYRDRKKNLVVRVLGKVTTEEALRIHKRKLQIRINTWRRQMRRMDERKNKIIALGNAVAYFTGINVKGIGEAYLRGVYNATALFCKYGMEDNIEGNFLSEYMGRPPETAGRTRLAWTRSYDKKPERKELYHRFCQYMERLKEENIENSGGEKY